MPEEDRDKRVIGLYGEMRLAMELHRRGWQVYRPYIDEMIDFVILKSYCLSCKDFRNAFVWEGEYEEKDGKRKKGKAIRNSCEKCKEETLTRIVRFIQVKTSEGIKTKEKKYRKYSFHPKLRYDLACGRVFYAWIQVWEKEYEQDQEKPRKVNYYLFQTKDVDRFDSLHLPTYKYTDNQKTSLRITREGVVTTSGRKYDYSVFKDFHNNFGCLEKVSDKEIDFLPLK